MQMNRVVIADCVSRSRKCSIPPSALPWPMSGRARASDTRMQRENTGIHELAQPQFLQKSLPMSPRCSRRAQRIRRWQRQFIARDSSKLRTAIVRSRNKAADTSAGKNAANGSMSAGAGVENDWPVAG